MPNTPLIIALCGAPNCGKSTAAQYITRRTARLGLACHVFNDLRTADEARVIRERGGVVVRIVRPGCEPSTEPQPIAADYTLHNTAGLYELAARIDELLQAMQRIHTLELEP